MHDNAIQFLLHCSTFHCAVPGLLKCCMLCIRLVWFRSLMHLGRAPNIDNWLLCLAWVGNFWSRSVLLKHPAQSCFLIDPASENPTNSWQRCATCEKKYQLWHLLTIYAFAWLPSTAAATTAANPRHTNDCGMAGWPWKQSSNQSMLEVSGSQGWKMLQYFG